MTEAGSINPCYIDRGTRVGAYEILDQIDANDAPRTPTGIGEFDRILGGGVVPGSAVLVGGEPGIGKSTLLLQVASTLAYGAGVGEALLGNRQRQLVRAGMSEPSRQTTVTGPRPARAGKL